MDWRDKSACLTVDPELFSPSATQARRLTKLKRQSKLVLSAPSSETPSVRNRVQPGFRCLGWPQ